MKQMRVMVTVGGLILSIAGAARAEDITISTYYPSPRGVYQELRTTNNTYLATQAGNVGIGTTIPATKLHITGAGPDASGIALTNTNAGGRTFYIEGGETAYNPGKLNFRDVSGGADPIMVMDGPTGNVGIGTTGPDDKLEVMGDLFLSNGTNSTILKLGGTDYQWQVLRDYADLGKFKIKYLQGNLDALTIGRDGNVGIGTTNPGANAKFEVNGAGAPDYALFSDFATATLRIGNDGGSNVRLRTDGTQNLALSPGGAERMRITTAGNVGIGTTSPGSGGTMPAATYKLDVIGAGDTRIKVQGSGTNPNNWTGLELNNAGYFQNLGDNRIAIWAGGERITINYNNGNVGIGTTGPAERLDVWGKIHATDTIRADSDARFKQDLQPLSGILPKLALLHGLSYTPSLLGSARGMSPGRELGVLGQELEQVFPELVSTSGPEQYRSVDYSRLTVVLLEAIKELKGEQAKAVRELKQEIDVLKEENQELRQRLTALEKPHR